MRRATSVRGYREAYRKGDGAPLSGNHMGIQYDKQAFEPEGVFGSRGLGTEAGRKVSVPRSGGLSRWRSGVEIPVT